MAICILAEVRYTRIRLVLYRIARSSASKPYCGAPARKARCLPVIYLTPRSLLSTSVAQYQKVSAFDRLRMEHKREFLSIGPIAGVVLPSSNHLFYLLTRRGGRHA